MTPTELQRLKQLCEKASAGPWTADGGYIYACGVQINHAPLYWNADAAFIAAARTALPALIAEVERLRSKADIFRIALEDIKTWVDQYEKNGDYPYALGAIRRVLRERLP